MTEPLIIELAGLPAAGKTSAAELLNSRLNARGVKCRVVEEAAQHNPLQGLKCDWPFNVWSSCRTLMDLLDAQARETADVVVVDRGLLDAQCWMLWFRQRHSIDIETYHAVRDFLRAPLWAASTSLVVELRVRFETALARRHGETGRIFNSDNFAGLSQAYEWTIPDRRARHDRTKLARIDTNSLSREEVVTRIEDLLPARLQSSPPSKRVLAG